ncbi:MAG: hypothetical protein ABIJ27_07935 [Candidatus Omnitrophota bacterium]
MYFRNNKKHSLFFRALSLVMACSFLLSNYAYAADPISPESATLAVNSIAELISERESAQQISGGTERADYVRTAFALVVVGLLYERIARKAWGAGLGPRATHAALRDEVAGQLTGDIGLSTDTIAWQADIAAEKFANERPAPEPAIRKSPTAAVKAPGYGLSTNGPDAEIEELKKYDRVSKDLMREGNALSLSSDVTIHLMSGVAVAPYAGSDPFLTALRARKGELSGRFNIIVLNDAENRLPAQIAFYSGYDTNEIVISKRYLESVSTMYELVDSDGKKQLVDIVLDAIRYSEKLQEHYSRTKGSVSGSFNPDDIEKIIPTHCASSLFRVAYTSQKVEGAIPNLNHFLKHITDSSGIRSSYLYAYEGLNAEDHLRFAGILLDGKPTSLDIILAQHHLGAVFTLETDRGSDLYLAALSLLVSSGAIDTDPDTGKPFLPEDFIEELVRLYSLIMKQGHYAAINAKLIDPEFEKYVDAWELGTQIRSGDSTYYPLNNETTALSAPMADVIEMIEAIPDSDVNRPKKAEIIESLREAEGGGTVIPRSALEVIGAPLMRQCSVSRSGAGEGTRYSDVEHDEKGHRRVFNIAKLAYKVPIDGLDKAWRSILEIAVATMREINNRYRSKMPFDVYTSYRTFKGATAELRRVGFRRTIGSALTGRFVFRHRGKLSPEVTVTQLRKTSLFNKSTGDFSRNVERGLPWTEVYWPDAHDSTFFDFITTGRAYECVNTGYRYRVISNIENLVGMPSAVILAIMYLTRAPVVTEGLVNEGQPGGAFVKFKPGQIPEAIDYRNSRGILEADEFSSEVMQRLREDRDLMRRYFPLFNGANYTLDVIQFMRDAFMPDAGDKEIVSRLKEFYDARNDERQAARLKHDLTRDYKRRTLRWEQHKGFDAVVPSTLAGTVTWLVPTVFLQIPSGPKSHRSTRYENLKRENLPNRVREKAIVEMLIRNNSPDTPLMGKVQLPFAADRDKLHYIRELYGKNDVTLRQILEQIEREIKDIFQMYQRAKDRGYINDYGDGEKTRASPTAMADEPDILAEPQTLPELTDDLSRQSDSIALRMVAKEDGPIDLSKIAIIVTEGLSERVVRNSGVDGVRADILGQLDRSEMQQTMGKLFNVDAGITRVDSVDGLIAVMEGLRKRNLKVVILDDGKLLGEIKKRQNEMPGSPGKDYCLVKTDVPDINAETEAPFMNLYVIALVGVAFLKGDYRLYRLAYSAARGEAPSETEEQFKEFIRQARWIISVIPRSMPYREDDFDRKRELTALFRTAA